MNEYIKVFSSVSDYNTFKASASYHTPNISYISGTDVVIYNPTIEYLQVPLPTNVKNYLTFIAQANGTFQFSSAVDYSVDNGITWSTLASNTSSPTVAAGSRIMWKATLTPTSSGIGTFSSTANFIVQGNAMSLLYGDNFIGQNSLRGKDYAFKDLFTGCTGITSAQKLQLPATTLSEGCYKNMFKNCTGMVIAPNLLAVTLTDSCYSNMFYGCTSLVESPELSAATLDDNCYEYMFYGCSSLTDIKCLATDITATGCTTNWVNGVASSGTFVKDSTMSSWTTGNNGIPTNWTVNTDQTDYSQQYLTFEVLEPGQFGIQTTGGNPFLYYSSDNGATWSSIQYGQYTETFSAGTKVIWKSTSYDQSYGVGKFNSSCNFNVSGNILSILRGDNFSQYTTLPSVSSGYGILNNLFENCKKLIRADKLYFPTNTTQYCYSEMFDGCTSLITAPQLPSTALTSNCYNNMFRNCTSLTIAPELPATTLANACYYAMFYGCSSLTTPPSLPATKLANACYSYMFEECTSLTIAPELPAGTITSSSSYSADNSYYMMFANCSNLHYIKCMARNPNSQTAVSIPSWVSGVSPTGTFVKAVNQVWSSGSSGIPSGWTVIEV